ncbi:MAG: ABC-F family ATP-binding cassette domain-containing protein [Bacteroidales bacterium]
MACYLQAENLSKSFGPQILFKNLNFNINEGEKIALIAPNGSGKTSLLKILAGLDSSDSGGSVKFMKEIKIAYLEQDPVCNPENNIFQEIFSSSGKIAEIVAEYESALHSNDPKRVERAINAMDHSDAWQFEQKIKNVLSQLNLEDLEQPMSHLSGGQIKRVALAGTLLREADFLILDEPTNHLDLEVIEYLEDYLKRSSCTLLMVTHDRYFLDRVCTEIFELDAGKLYNYKGNYSYFLEKRQERVENFNSETERARNLLRTELDWMRRMPQARATKAKYRINAFYDLKERADQNVSDKRININVKTSRLGKKIINCKGVSHFYADYCTIDDFTYNFARYEKIGIVGKNGVGKSTFLNVITGALEPSSGTIEQGETIVFGYYKQDGLEFNPEDTVIDVVREIAEVVTLGDGKVATVSQFLNYFLFPPNMHYTKVEKLSGGEKRRLYLITVLMKNPNFLILDEPTNDLDILTLNVLEEYLKNFPGCLILVSHDRYFLDKLADHLFVFQGNGKIKDYVGTFADYREWVRSKTSNAVKSETRKEAHIKKNARKEKYNLCPVITPDKRKLTFKEQRELQQLEADIDLMEKEKNSLEVALSSGKLSPEDLYKSSTRIGEIISLIDSKSERWLELND